MNRILKNAVGAALGFTVMAGYSSQASAFNSSNLGTYTGTAISFNTSTSSQAFTKDSAGGSSHGSNRGSLYLAKFLRLTVGSATDIAAGAKYDVQLKMTGRGSLANNPTSSAIDNPSFAVWSAGANAIDTASVEPMGFHSWNPARGYLETVTDINGDSTELWVNHPLVQAGVISGRAGWVGYVNSGPEYTIVQELDPLGSQPLTANGVAVHEAISHGALNTDSLMALTNPSASSTSYTNNFYRVSPGGDMVGSEPDYAMMTLYGLKAGNYLIATGGSCPDFTDIFDISNPCGRGSGFTFEVSQVPAAVPLPGAVCLFGTAIAGLMGVGRRKDNLSA